MQVLKAEYIEMLERFVGEYHKRNGRAPSISEMSEELGIPRTTVHRYLTRMKERGILVADEGGKSLPRLAKKLKRDTIPLPILGSVSCGIPKYAEENIEEYVQVPASWFGSGTFFALRADGESMINAGIDSGDLVIIRQQNYADPGQIVVALIDNEEATLKRFRPKGNGRYIDLIPENDAFTIKTVDQKYESLVIQGIAVKVLKDLE